MRQPFAKVFEEDDDSEEEIDEDQEEGESDEDQLPLILPEHSASSKQSVS